MNINWQEAEEKPDKKQKVDGKELLGLREIRKNLEKELSETRQELSHIKQVLEETTRELEETKRKAAEKEKVNDDLVSQILELNETLESYGTQIKNLEMSLDKLSSISYDYNEEIANLKIKLKQTERKLEDSDQKLEESNQKLKEAHKTINKQEGRISALSTQLEEKKGVLPKIDENDQKISEIYSQLQEKENELKKARNLLEEKENIIEDKNTSISELESQLHGKSNALKNLILKMENSDHPIEELYNPSPEIEFEETKPKEERVRCPKCGAFGKDVRAMVDRTKVLRYQGQTRIYAKKRVCKKCGTEF